MPEETTVPEIRFEFDNALIRQLLTIEAPEELQALFKERGVDVSPQDAIKVKHVIMEATFTKEGEDLERELSENELDRVAAGGIVYIRPPVIFVDR
ncbi:hypothetical protein [Anoxynatronum buryatiense]|uniref:Uncharacterized protein n=1 Tax=Anoxynatronum buryatiense TaxID=489973 RepID=A0AA45WWS0_9CLOT|nr:hypothetical protein [Anoxynatronum buryatiense]SMP60323.1 hypothetical protein SAMN06296020_108106 [Anoxynatronum buryatiense]